VTLTPSQRLDVHRAYTLTAIGTGAGAITGSDGLALDGAGNGRPGSDFTTSVTWTALTAPGAAPAVTFAGGRARAYEGRFAPYTAPIVRATHAALRAARAPLATALHAMSARARAPRYPR
jgi:large repetitive protein